MYGFGAIFKLTGLGLIFFYGKNKIMVILDLLEDWHSNRE